MLSKRIGQQRIFGDEDEYLLCMGKNTIYGYLATEFEEIFVGDGNGLVYGNEDSERRKG